MLIDGETISFKDKEIGLNESTLSDNEINQKYIKGDVRIITEQARYPLDAIKDMVNSEKYKLNPEYQRRHRWDTVRKSKLIESLIINVPIPPIFLYEYKFAHYEVMDGLQRLTAISDFYKNSFSLEGLEEWSELNGRTYSSLPEEVRNGIDRRYLSSIILLEETAKNKIEAEKLKQMVFERINSGGVKLSDQESRNAIFNGPFNQLCLQLAQNVALKKMWFIPTEDDYQKDNLDLYQEELLINQNYAEMLDAEIVLRFFAYRQKGLHEARFKTIKAYLDSYLDKANKFPEATLIDLKNMFEQVIELIYKVFNIYAFLIYKYRPRREDWIWVNKPTFVVYDPLVQVFSKNLDRYRQLVNHAESIGEKIEIFYQENSEDFDGRKTSSKDIENRVQKYEEFFNGFL